MPEIEKKEFMTLVIPIHCGDPLGKQQTIQTNKNKVQTNEEIFHLTALLWSVVLRSVESRLLGDKITK